MSIPGFSAEASLYKTNIQNRRAAGPNSLIDRTPNAAPQARGRQEELFDLLAFLTGHLEIASSADEQAVDVLRDELSRPLTHTDLAAVKNRYFSIENSDLFFADAVAPRQRAQILQLADRIAKDTTPPDLRVFVRDLPFR